ncbi:MAG: LysR family transcriptional regulator, partial [Burkholderiales bacterium]
LEDANLFVRVTELGTLSAAAAERNEPVSQVSRAIVRIEKSLGVRLLHRTTHGLSLTDEGDTFVAYARRILDTAAELDAELSGRLSGPSGWVRVAVSPILAQLVIAPSLRSLYKKHPKLQIDIAADDRAIDLSREGIDVAIRAGVAMNENLVARKIGEHGRRLYASPQYLRDFGTPKTVEDLEKHRLIANSASQSLNRWALLLNAAQASAPRKRPIINESLSVKGHTRADNTSIVLALALEGVGIARLNELLVSPLVASGQLVQVLSKYEPDTRNEVYAVMLPERHRLPKVRACIDHWEASFLALTKKVG